MRVDHFDVGTLNMPIFFLALSFEQLRLLDWRHIGRLIWLCVGMTGDEGWMSRQFLLNSE